MSDEANSWPEQDAVYKWMKQNGIDVPHKDVIPLLEELTKPRIAVQRLANQYEDEFNRRGVSTQTAIDKAKDLTRQLAEVTAERDALRADAERANEYGDKAVREISALAAALHWPECWDTAAYPSLDACIKELFHCSTCEDKTDSDKIYYATRWEWLRQHSVIYDHTIIYGAGFNQTKPELLDAAIDAAMIAERTK